MKEDDVERLIDSVPATRPNIKPPVHAQVFDFLCERYGRDFMENNHTRLPTPEQHAKNTLAYLQRKRSYEVKYELTDEQKAVCEKAVSYFGRRAQLKKVAEELYELALECDNAADGRGDAGALALERADVAVVLYQFDELLLPSLRKAVPAKIASQIDRLERRLADE